MPLSIYNYSFYHQICSLHFNHSQETVSFYTLVNSLLPSQRWPLRVYPYENLKKGKEITAFCMSIKINYPILAW